MIEAAWMEGSWLKVRVNGSEKQLTTNIKQLQGYTSKSVSYIDKSGWLKVWHVNGQTETIRHLG